MRRPFLAVVAISAFGGLIPWSVFSRAYVGFQIGCLAVLLVCFLIYVMHRIWRGGKA